MSFKAMEFNGERLNCRRNSMGIKLDDLARRIGRPTGQGYISDLERGKRKNPSLNVINALARELDVDALYFFEDIATKDMLPYMTDDVLNFIMEEGNDTWIRFAISIKNLGYDRYEFLQTIELIDSKKNQ